MSRFGFGISGLYKSEPTFFFVFGSLYRERYFCSYSLISSCFALRFALKCGLRVSLPRATSCCVQDVDFFTPDFGSLYRERYFCSYSFRSFIRSVFGFGISGLYKSESTFFFVFGCLYRERYFCSYSFRSFLRSVFGIGISGLYKSELVLFCGFGSLYRERYFCSYYFRSFLTSRLGFGISGLYKSELVLFCGFGSLYRVRYCFSYSLISFCFVLRFALTY